MKGSYLKTTIVAGLAALGLAAGMAFTPVAAHCKGKHTGSHPHCSGGGSGGGGSLKHTGTFDDSVIGITSDGDTTYTNGGKGKKKVVHVSDTTGWRLDSEGSTGKLEGGIRDVMVELAGCTGASVPTDVDMRLQQNVVSLGAMADGQAESVAVMAIMPPSFGGCTGDTDVDQYVLVIGPEVNVYDCLGSHSGTGIRVTRTSGLWEFRTPGTNPNACLITHTGGFAEQEVVWSGRVDMSLNVCDLADTSSCPAP